MPFWLGTAIAERFEGSEGRSVSVAGDSFASFGAAIEGLSVMEPRAVAGQVIEANAYVVRAGTIEEAIELLVSVFDRHAASPQVKLVAMNIGTRQVEPEPPDQEALSRVHGELCISHQISTLVLSLAPSGEYRDRLVRHTEAIEDLGYALRVMQAEMAGQEPPVLPPRGSERLGYGAYRLGGSETATLTSALASLASELGIAQHQAREARNTLPSADDRLEELLAELGAFVGTVNEHS